MSNRPETGTRASGSVRRPRKRAPVACQSCHARKVRCSLPQTGAPCANCSLDNVSCAPRVGRRFRPELRSPPLRIPSPSNIASTAQANHLESCSFPPNPESLVASEIPSPNSGHGHVAPLADTGASTPYRPLNEHFSHRGEEGETDTVQTGGDTPESRYSPLYGDPRGVALVVDICEPERKEKSGHFLVPRINPTHIDPETIDYLRLKGVFNLPTHAVCDTLIQIYFHHVHPFFPIVEANSFLGVFETSRDEISIHLLWSMFLAAANFADDATLKAANFSSRKEMKHSMYIRAKALYDAEYERRKITLIQAVLLMGFWYSDTEDRTGPWHWNGIAISLCQTIGLYRLPDTSENHLKTISASDRRLWRQIWWSCLYREAWFSAGMGRPMRISLADCNTPMPDANDSDELLAGLPDSIRKKYIPEGTEDLSKLWTELLCLTVSLSNILSWQHRAERTWPSRTEIGHMEDKIREYYHRKDHNMTHGHRQIVSSHAYHLDLYLESVILILYRPFLLEKPEVNSPSASANEWRSNIERKMRAAAMSTNGILGNMASADMISSCQSMICIALVPTLQVYLVDSTSTKSLVRRMGIHNLELCMVVIEELKTTYFGAEILFRMFTKAQSQVRNRRVAAAAAAAGKDVHQSSSNADAGIVTDVADDVYPNNMEALDVFSVAWNPFAQVAANGFLDNNELMSFESDFTLSQSMFPEIEQSSEITGRSSDNTVL